MLGDRIGDEAGKIVLQRVLPSAPGAAKMETTQRGAGTMLGVKYQTSSTYEAEVRPDGTLYGGGQGVVTGEGGEMATWVGHGVGAPKPDGSVSFRGAIYIYSTAKKWARLNGVASLFEYDVDADGNYTSAVTEWK